MMKKMKTLLVLLIWLGMGAGTAGAEEMVTSEIARAPGYGNESAAYTFDVKEDGTATVSMRADGVVMKMGGGEYKLTLPDGVEGEVSAWYRENGCPRYDGLICIWQGGNAWIEAEVKREGETVMVIVPEREVAKQDEQVGLSVGLVYRVADVTDKKWWGREVSVATGKSDNFVSYLSVGVYLPEGVYGRDKQQGPSGWEAALTEIAGGRSAAPAMDAKMAGPAILDAAGGGQHYRYRQNIAPGEDYTFTLMSSTSRWKLYSRELGITGLWVGAIAVVLSLLLYLIVGKKPWWWYGLVTLLLVTLFILIMGLWISYRFGLSDGRGDYPVPLMMTRDAGVVMEGEAPVERGE